MSSTLGEIKGRVRSLLDAPGPNTYLTDDFIVPLINQVYEDCNSQLETTQSSWDIAVVEVPGVQPGTPNLAAEQIGSGPLAGLVNQPIRIDWKAAGTDPAYYQLVRDYEVLPDFQPQQGMPGYEWRSEVIWLGMCSIAVDLRVRGEFGPSPLVDDDDILISHPRIGYVISYGTAALIAIVRGNKDWAAEYGSKAVEGMDEIMGQLTRPTQGQTRRVGRMVRRGGNGANWNAIR